MLKDCKDLYGTNEYTKRPVKLNCWDRLLMLIGTYGMSWENEVKFRDVPLGLC